jgi:hypothetical protein
VIIDSAGLSALPLRVNVRKHRFRKQGKLGVAKHVAGIYC